MTAFIDEHRGDYGVEPICKVLPIAASTYYTHAARKADPERRPNRAWRDEAPCAEIRRVWEENRSTGCARSGGSRSERVTKWRAARWRG
jgi:putative transposase